MLKLSRGILFHFGERLECFHFGKPSSVESIFSYICVPISSFILPMSLPIISESVQSQHGSYLKTKPLLNKGICQGVHVQAMMDMKGLFWDTHFRLIASIVLVFISLTEFLNEFLEHEDSLDHLGFLTH